MNLDNVYSRFDDEDFQIILSDELLGTLRILDPTSLYQENLIKILNNTFSKQEILQNINFRNIVFDKLRESEIESLSQLLGLNSTVNLYDQIKNYNFRSESLKKVFQYFEIQILEKQLSKKIDFKKILPEYVLYPYQNDVLSQVDKYLKSEKNRVLLHMPTGSGKTRTAMSYVCKYLNENKGCIVVWFANTVELIDQSFDEFEKAWTKLGNREIDLIKYSDRSTHKLEELTEGLVVCGIDKLMNYYNRSILNFTTFAAKCSLVIFDEAHMVVAEKYNNLVNALVNFNKIKLIGLSATPGRTWSDRSEDRRLSEYFFKQKATIKIEGYDNPVIYLEQKGYLAKIINTQLLSSSGIAISEDDIQYLKSNSKLPNQILEKISHDKTRNVIIVSKMKELIKVHKRIILFSINVKHAIILNGILTSIGIKSSVLTSETDPDKRNEIIQNYKKSVIDEPDTIVICNYGILTTGFDAPQTSCAVISRPTDSLVLYSQMVGRATRGINSGGNKEAEIVTVIDTNLPGFRETSSAFFNWEDIWE